MLDKEIFECCRKLRLSRNLAELAQTTEGSSHQEYLYQLLSDELRYRELSREYSDDLEPLNPMCRAI